MVACTVGEGLQMLGDARLLSNQGPDRRRQPPSWAKVRTQLGGTDALTGGNGRGGGSKCVSESL